MEAPKKKGRVGIIVLSILTGLLTLGAAGMTTLYFVEKSERTAADKKVGEQAATIAAEQSKVKDLEGKWALTKSEVAKLTQEVEGAKSKTADVTKEREALAACFRAIETYASSQTNANRVAANAACDEASTYY
jgi:flagellar basal body-associated protein FliL